MTLVVIWRTDTEIFCAADSRITSDKSPITDAGAKIFVVPVVVHAAQGEKFVPKAHASFGFSFAGSTLAATNTHALASSCLQLLHSRVVAPPSLKEVAEFYGRVADFCLRDMNSRRNGDYLTFVGLLFGYCKKVRKFGAFKIGAEISDGKFAVTVEDVSPDIGQAVAIGSGIPAFVEASKQKLGRYRPPTQMEAFLEVVEGESDATVGGYPQLAVGTDVGVHLRPILTQDEANKDVVKLTMLGFNLSEFGKIGELDIGFEAQGIGTERVAGRHALREKGIDPDSGPVDQKVQNLASVEASLKALRDKKLKAITIDDIYTLAPVRPVMGQTYFGATCGSCNSMAPFCVDPNAGALGIPFVGSGKIRYVCASCKQPCIATVEQIRALVWNLPTVP